MSALKAHLRTLWPVVRNLARPPEDAPSRPWSLVVDRVDGHDGLYDVVLTGKIHHIEGARALVVLVHGLGGCCDSGYLIPCAKTAHALGFSTLRVNLRGADRRGHDLYHAGLSSDLARVVGAPELARYERIVLLGFSLGGHVVLHYGVNHCGTHCEDPRVKAVAAVCPPLDLHLSVTGFDRPGAWAYRRYILNHLVEMYTKVAARRPLPFAVDEIRRARTLRDWDRLTVVPRYGFADTEEYYAHTSVAPRLPEMHLPTLVVAADHDPMVVAECIRPALADVPSHLEAHWIKSGGHVGFSSRLDLGLGEPYGISGQALLWLRRRLEAAA